MLLQHEISHQLFKSDLLLNGSYAKSSRVAGSLQGGRIKADIGNYGSDWDLDYGIALFSQMSEPGRRQSFDAGFGFYGGAFVANSEDHGNDVNSRGTFAGFNTFWEGGRPTRPLRPSMRMSVTLKTTSRAVSADQPMSTTFGSAAACRWACSLRS